MGGLNDGRHSSFCARRFPLPKTAEERKLVDTATKLLDRHVAMNSPCVRFRLPVQPEVTWRADAEPTPERLPPPCELEREPWLRMQGDHPKAKHALIHRITQGGKHVLLFCAASGEIFERED